MEQAMEKNLQNTEVKEAVAEEKQELNDEQLEQVDGGLTNYRTKRMPRHVISMPQEHGC